MEVLGGNFPIGQGLGGLLGAPLGRAIHDGSAQTFFCKRVLECLMNVFDALRGRGRHDDEFEICAFRTAVDHLER